MGGLSGSLPSRCALGDVPKRTFGGQRTMERTLGRSLSADLEGPKKIFYPSLNNRLWLHIWGGTAAPPDVQSHAPQKKIFLGCIYFGGAPQDVQSPKDPDALQISPQQMCNLPPPPRKTKKKKKNTFVKITSDRITHCRREAVKYWRRWWQRSMIFLFNLAFVCWFSRGVAFLLPMCHPKNEAKGDPLCKLIVRLVRDLLNLV